MTVELQQLRTAVSVTLLLLRIDQDLGQYSMLQLKLHENNRAHTSTAHNTYILENKNKNIDNVMLTRERPDTVHGLFSLRVFPVGLRPSFLLAKGMGRKGGSGY